MINLPPVITNPPKGMRRFLCRVLGHEWSTVSVIKEIDDRYEIHFEYDVCERCKKATGSRRPGYLWIEWLMKCGYRGEALAAHYDDYLKRARNA